MIQAPNLQNIPSPMLQNVQQQGNQVPMQQPVTGQYPGAIYNYPVGSSYLPAQQREKSQFNGVNIEIVNPQGQGGYGIPQQQSAVMQSQNGNGQFNGVNLEILNPQGQGVTGGYAQNLVPAQYYPIPQQYNNAPFIQQQPLPQSPIVQQQPIQQMPPYGNVQEIPLPPEPVIQNVPQNNAPVIDAPTQQISDINPESFAGRLKTNDLDAQRTAIEDIAEIVRKPVLPEDASQNDIDAAMEKWRVESHPLLDSMVFDGLADIVNKDVSYLPDATPEALELRQKNPNELTEQEKQIAQLTPKENAITNKQFALYTISFMHEAVNERMEETKGQALELKDLPHIDTVLDAIEKNESPKVRTAGILALAHINRPEYTDHIQTIFEIVQNNDPDADVRDAASAALERISAENNS